MKSKSINNNIKYMKYLTLLQKKKKKTIIYKLSLDSFTLTILLLTIEESVFSFSVKLTSFVLT